MAKQLWVVYDGRAETMDTDDCLVYVSCDSLPEARQYVKEDFPDGVIFRYDIKDNELTNETREY
jgi:hypothetical protein